MLQKDQLRKLYKEKRSILTDEQVQHLSKKIAQKVESMDIFQKQYFHIFLSMQGQKEVDTQYIIHTLVKKGKSIITSRTLFKENTLKHFIITPQTTIVLSKWGIPEPTDAQEVAPTLAQVVFVPLLACDIWGTRVGYGKGFYDRFLEKCPTNTLKIGLSFFPPETNRIDANELDIPIDILVSPENVWNMVK